MPIFSKEQIAYRDFDCERCLELIMEDDEFYFLNRMGDSMKVCPSCKEELEEEYETKLNEKFGRSDFEDFD